MEAQPSGGHCYNVAMHRETPGAHSRVTDGDERLVREATLEEVLAVVTHADLRRFFLACNDLSMRCDAAELAFSEWLRVDSTEFDEEAMFVQSIIATMNSAGVRPVEASCDTICLDFNAARVCPSSCQKSHICVLCGEGHALLEHDLSVTPSMDGCPIWKAMAADFRNVCRSLNLPDLRGALWSLIRPNRMDMQAGDVPLPLSGHAGPTSVQQTGTLIVGASPIATALPVKKQGSGGGDYVAFDSDGDDVGTAKAAGVTMSFDPHRGADNPNQLSPQHDLIQGLLGENRLEFDEHLSERENLIQALQQLVDSCGRSVLRAKWEASEEAME